MKKLRLMLVDDQSLFREALRTLLALQPDFEIVAEAENGERAVALAKVHKPDVILMDEPCSALDPIATARIEELIHELRGRYAIVIVTHNMQQAARVSQRTAYFHLGHLVEHGDTDRIFTNPANKQTEAYISGKIG